MGLSPKLKRAKADGGLFAKELTLAGYRAYVPKKSKRKVLIVWIGDWGHLSVRGSKGRWYVEHVPDVRFWHGKTVASAHKLDQIFVKVKEWLRENG